jgi:hypothetical protein
LCWPICSKCRAKTKKIGCADRGPDAYFTRCWVGKKFDVLDALLELIKDGNAPFDERAAIERWRYTPRPAIELTHPKKMFEVGNRP